MKIGFIGAGNLGGSVVRGLFNAKAIQADSVIISEPSETLASMYKNEFCFEIAESNATLVKNSSLIIIAVKPYLMEGVLKEIAPFIDTQVIVSLAAGFSTQMMESIIPNAHFIRILTNTPASLNAATSTASIGKNTKRDEFEAVVNLFRNIGIIEEIDEKFMDLSTALAGSGPAFFYEVANAFAKGCIEIGLDEKQAIVMSAQTMLGAAKMLLNSGKTPELLIKEVTTPNGCTYEGLKYMSEHDTGNILAQTMVVTTNRAATLASK